MELNPNVVSKIAEKLNSDTETVKKVLQSDKDSEDEQSFITNADSIHPYSEDELEKLQNNKFEEGKKEGEKNGAGNTYGAMDKRIQQEFGIEKKEGEKTIDYLTRAAEEKAKANGQKPNEQVERLKQELKDKDEALQNALGEKEKVETEFHKEKRQMKIQSKLDSVVNSLPIQAEDDQKAQASKEFLKYQFQNNYDIEEDENGAIILKDKTTGKEVKDPKTADYKDITSVMQEFAPNWVSLKSDDVRKKGNGLQDTPISNEGFQKGEIDYSQYKDVDQLKEHLTNSGYALTDPKAQDILSGYIEKSYEVEK